MSVAPSQLRILCFGASITAGYYRMGMGCHPYAYQLKRQLQQHLPQTKIDIHIDALAGDQVVQGKYLSRLHESCGDKSTNKFDWIIVQGGGNDILHDRSPEEIFQSLKSIWKLALESSTEVLALTVTETAVREQSVRAKYEALNRMILSHCESGITVADVCSALPWPATKVEQSAIWDDGLHFLPKGYDLIGSFIAEVLLNRMSLNGTAKM